MPVDSVGCCSGGSDMVANSAPTNSRRVTPGVCTWMGCGVDVRGGGASPKLADVDVGVEAEAEAEAWCA